MRVLEEIIVDGRDIIQIAAKGRIFLCHTIHSKMTIGSNSKKYVL